MDRDFFTRYYEAYNSEDPARLTPFYAGDVRLLSAQGEIRGRDAVLDTYRGIIGQFVDRMCPRNIVVDGDQAAVEIIDRFEARTDVDDFLGRRFTRGDSFELKLCGIYRVEDEQITGITLYQR